MNSNILLEKTDGTNELFDPDHYDATIGFATTGYVNCRENIGNFTYSNCCCLYNREYINKLNIYFLDGLDYSDNYFHIATLLPQEKIYITNKNAYHYRIHEKSICASDRDKLCSHDIIDVYHTIFEYYLAHDFASTCKINFYELKKYFHRFIDPCLAFDKLYSLYTMIAPAVESHPLLYTFDELYFFRLICRCRRYSFFEYALHSNSSYLSSIIKRLREKVEKRCETFLVVSKLRMHASKKLAR